MSVALSDIVFFMNTRNQAVLYDMRIRGSPSKRFTMAEDKLCLAWVELAMTIINESF